MTGGSHIINTFVQGSDYNGPNNSGTQPLALYLCTKNIIAGGPNVKGSWTTILANTGSDAGAISVGIIGGSNGVANVGLIAFDIGIGAPGSEFVVVSNLLIGTGGSIDQSDEYQLTLPLDISKGNRIAIRAQNGLANAATSCECYAKVGCFAPGEPYTGPFISGYDALGVNVDGTTVGTSVVTGTGPRPAWTQFVASTNRDYLGIFFKICFNNNTNDGFSFTAYNIQIAAGASGSETIICNDGYSYGLGGYGQWWPSQSQFYPISIPKGTRLSLCILSTISGTGANCTFAAYGAYL